LIFAWASSPLIQQTCQEIIQKIWDIYFRMLKWIHLPRIKVFLYLRQRVEELTLHYFNKNFLVYLTWVLLLWSQINKLELIYLSLKVLAILILLLQTKRLIIRIMIVHLHKTIKLAKSWVIMSTILILNRSLMSFW
jgi:hypothetical protein